MGCLFCLTVSAQQLTDDEWLKKSQKIMKDVEKSKQPDWLIKPTDLNKKTVKQTQNFINQLKKLNASQTPTNKTVFRNTANGEVIVFVSLGMGSSMIKSLLKEYADRDNVSFIVRGIRKNSTMGKFSKELYNLVKGIENPPSLEVNPTLFTKYKVSQVPMMVFNPSSDRPVIVRGSTSVDWFIEKSNARLEEKLPLKGLVDLGKFGEMSDIIEPDLIKVIQARMLAIDWNKKKKEAMKRYWKKTPFVSLTPAKKNRRYSVDLTVLVTKDIRGPNGKLIAKAGQRLNPVNMMPLTSTIIVFSGLSKNEIALAIKEGEKIKKTNRPVVFIMTEFDITDGFDEYQRIEEEIGHKVYLLNLQLAKRYNIQHTLSMLTTKNGLMWVQEIKPDA